jgi:hypothetical protein
VNALPGFSGRCKTRAEYSRALPLLLGRVSCQQCTDEEQTGRWLLGVNRPKQGPMLWLHMAGRCCR